MKTQTLNTKWNRQGIDYVTTKFHLGQGMRLFVEIKTHTHPKGIGNGLIYKYALVVENQDGKETERVPMERLPNGNANGYKTLAIAMRKGWETLANELAAKGVALPHNPNAKAATVGKPETQPETWETEDRQGETPKVEISLETAKMLLGYAQAQALAQGQPNNALVAYNALEAAIRETESNQATQDASFK